MKHQVLCLIALLLAICSLQCRALTEEEKADLLQSLSDEEKQKLKPQPTHIDHCNEKFPHFSAGDFNLTQQNFTQALKKYQNVLVIVSASWCNHCCRYEEYFHNLTTVFLKNRTLLETKIPVTVARIDLEKNEWFKDKYQFDQLPSLIFFKKETPYRLGAIYDHTSAINAIFKALHPFAKLKNLEEVEDFLKYDVPVEKRPFSIRVIALFNGKEGNKEDIEQFKEAAEAAAIRPDVYFALLTNKEETKRAKLKYGSLWFDRELKSTIFLQRETGKISKIDLETSEMPLSQSLYLKSMRPVERLTHASVKAFAMKKVPMVLLFVNRESEPNSSNAVIRRLEKVAVEFENKLSFAWVENAGNENKRIDIGIRHNRVPAMAFNLPKSDGRQFVFPPEWDFTEENMREFILRFLSGELKDLSTVKPPSGEAKPAPPRNKLYDLIPAVKELNTEDFKELVLEEGKDVLVLFWKPSEKEDDEYISHYNRASERFRDLKIDSVLIASYDLEIYRKPHQFKVLDAPSIFFFPAYDKKEPFRAYTDNPMALSMMKYIEKNADVKFKLPDLPHLPESLHAEYYHQKMQKEKEKAEREAQEAANKENGAKEAQSGDQEEKKAQEL